MTEETTATRHHPQWDLMVDDDVNLHRVYGKMLSASVFTADAGEFGATVIEEMSTDELLGLRWQVKEHLGDYGEFVDYVLLAIEHEVAGRWAVQHRAGAGL